MADLAETLLWLCNVPSPIGEERALCDAVVERVSRVPLAAPIRRYGDSIVVPLVRGTGKPHIVLAGHLDVVRTVHDAPPRIEGDKLYGAGSADMKSGLALMLDIAERQTRPNTDLTLVFYAREEGPFAENELGPVLEQDPDVTRAALAIALEPSDNKLQLGCGGSLHATVAFVGRTAHSARPWQGENAIHKAAAFLAKLGALEPVSEIVDGLEWKSVVSATMASGGRGRNVIPDRFELNLNHRFGPGTTIAAAQANIERLVAGQAELTFTDLSPSAPPSREHPLVLALAESGVLAIEPKQAWTDVARLHAAGVPAVNFGPGTNAQAHQRNEWTHLPGLAVGQGILARFLAKVGGVAAACLALGLAAAASGCDQATGAVQRRTDAVADTVPSARPAFERAEVRSWLAALRRTVGTARVLMLDVREHQVTVQFEAKARPGEVMESVIEDGRSSEPQHAELRGAGDLAANLFALGDVSLEKIPDLATAAAAQVDAQDGRIVRVLVRRDFPHSDAVRLRVYVESPRSSGSADFDANGNPVPAPVAGRDL